MYADIGDPVAVGTLKINPLLNGGEIAGTDQRLQLIAEVDNESHVNARP
jgi:hypothetical protein